VDTDGERSATFHPKYKTTTHHRQVYERYWYVDDVYSLVSSIVRTSPSLVWYQQIT